MIKIIKNCIKKMLYKFPFIIRNYILLESVPTYADNTKNVFEEMIKRNINEKYKIYWITSENINEFKNLKYNNVYFINRENKFKFFYLRFHAKFIIDCNAYIDKLNCKQTRIYLTHGMPLKLAEEYCKISGNIDYMTLNSEYFTEKMSELFDIDKKKILITGAARNDSIYKNSEVLFPEINRKKTILWMPTYRNHCKTNTFQGRTNIKFKYGVPCINEEKQILELNKILEKENILLIIKLHPQEDKKNIKELELGNIKLLDNDYFSCGKTIYDYLRKVDALITDYSSIYFDFLLTNNMIGLAIPDINEYSKHVKLINNNNYESSIVGDYIYNFEDLKQFVVNVSNGIDKNKNLREKAKMKYNKYDDGKSSKRIVDFIENLMKEN